jgi:hypothetical protein
MSRLTVRIGRLRRGVSWCRTRGEMRDETGDTLKGGHRTLGVHALACCSSKIEYYEFRGSEAGEALEVISLLLLWFFLGSRWAIF